MKRVLFICNTPYQLYMACYITYQNKEIQADIIVSDHFPESEMIVKRINKLQLIFRKAYFVKDFDFCRRKGKWKIIRNKNRLLYHLNIKKTMHRFLYLEERYDELWIANWEEFANVTWNYIRRYDNPDIKCVCFEDGYVTCVWDWRKSAHEFHVSRLRKWYEERVMDIKYTHDNFSEYHVLRPELMAFHPGCAVYKISTELRNEDAFIDNVNKIFNYDSCKDIYDKKIIFFEESYFADGKDIGDAEIVDALASVIGKDNIMVKIHPRSRANRWKVKGYKTNEDTSIPWEIIMLNQDMTDKIMIGICCGSIVSSYFIYEIGGKSISLMDICKIESDIFNEKNVYDVAAHTFRTMFTNLYQNVVYFPTSVEDIKKYIQYEKGES